MTIRIRKIKHDSDQGRIQDEYFNWMMNLAYGEKRSTDPSWDKLFRLLHETEFVNVMEMDANRIYDGIDLRYGFAYRTGISTIDINKAFADRPCSILEMMVALAKRCEDQITFDQDVGDRTWRWVFEMISNLGLIDMDDEHFDIIEAEDILERFIRREYLPSGKGGLFIISNRSVDMRDAEIWDQMMWYLNETIYKGGYIL